MFNADLSIFTPVRRRVASLAVLVAFLLLASCATVQLSYNNADVAIRWKVQQYFDLQGEQETAFKARLGRFHAWHRTEELPRYEALFHAAGERVADGVSAEDIVWATRSLRERYHLLLTRAAAGAAPVLATLTPGQLDHLDKQFTEANLKFAKEHLIGKEDKQRKDRLQRMRANMADWIGDLTSAQESRIAEMVRTSPSLAIYRLEERRQLQSQFMEIVHAQHDPRALAAGLQGLVDGMDVRRSPAHQRAMQQYESALSRLLMDLDKTLTPAQRSHVIQKFSDLSRDFKTLALKSRAPVAASQQPAG